tara:strand:- start:36 stop:263 length:228 start_codon:yes stop_codon:yes gene_type:complete
MTKKVNVTELQEALHIAGVRRSFTIEDLKKAFNDGCELINQEWHEAEFCIGEKCGCKGVKLDYDNFDEWMSKNYA